MEDMALVKCFIESPAFKHDVLRELKLEKLNIIHTSVPSLQMRDNYNKIHLQIQKKH